jgi:hypothetical protein
VTTRRFEPGTLADFKRTWRPERHRDGMLHAYAYCGAAAVEFYVSQVIQAEQVDASVTADGGG